MSALPVPFEYLLVVLFQTYHFVAHIPDVLKVLSDLETATGEPLDQDIMKISADERQLLVCRS